LPVAAVGSYMKVLVGVGGADDSLRALRRTVERAREAGDDVTVGVFEGDRADRSLAETERTVRSILEEESFDAEVRHLGDDPGSALIHTAESESFDEIALSGGETSPMGKITVNSVLEFVLLNSHVTVRVVR
jgi:nucleotide-binding universal stress UspA family protein